MTENTNSAFLEGVCSTLLRGTNTFSPSVAVTSNGRGREGMNWLFDEEENRLNEGNTNRDKILSSYWII